MFSSLSKKYPLTSLEWWDSMCSNMEPWVTKRWSLRSWFIYHHPKVEAKQILRTSSYCPFLGLVYLSFPSVLYIFLSVYIYIYITTLQRKVYTYTFGGRGRGKNAVFSFVFDWVNKWFLYSKLHLMHDQNWSNGGSLEHNITGTD